jgi:hypothetical protein
MVGMPAYQRHWFHRLAALPAAVLCMAVVFIHIKDQGGLPGSKSPGYVGFGYYLLEVAAFLAAIVLAMSKSVKGWVLALAVAAGPIIGYALSRGPGLPSYADDRRNWTETIGVISLVVEGSLLVIAVLALYTATRSGSRRELSRASA